jgi:hypothetical protein
LRHDVLVGLLLVIAPEVELAFTGIAQDGRVLVLPALKPVLLGIGLAVNLQEGEQLLQQTVAGELERDDRALEALQEQGADQADDLPLPVFFEGVDPGIPPLYQANG